MLYIILSILIFFGPIIAIYKLIFWVDGGCQSSYHTPSLTYDDLMELKRKREEREERERLEIIREKESEEFKKSLRSSAYWKEKHKDQIIPF
jgi:hypothetical protein